MFVSNEPLTMKSMYRSKHIALAASLAAVILGGLDAEAECRVSDVDPAVVAAMRSVIHNPANIRNVDPDVKPVVRAVLAFTGVPGFESASASSAFSASTFENRQAGSSSVTPFGNITNNRNDFETFEHRSHQHKVEAAGIWARHTGRVEPFYMVGEFNAVTFENVQEKMLELGANSVPAQVKPDLGAASGGTGPSRKAETIGELYARVVRVTARVAGATSEGEAPIVCNGVYMGAGRILTNAHCLRIGSNVDYEIGLGLRYVQQAKSVLPEMYCDAALLAPAASLAKTEDGVLDVAVLSIENAGVLPTAFRESRFHKGRLAYVKEDPWAGVPTHDVRNPLDGATRDAKTLVLMQIQENFPKDKVPYKEMTESAVLTEFGTDKNPKSQCYAGWGDRKTPSNVCTPKRRTNDLRPDYKLKNEGRPHGCESEKRSSGAPLFISVGGGKYALAGINRTGRTKAVGEQRPTDKRFRKQNWNCAVSVKQMDNILTQTGL